MPAPRMLAGLPKPVLFGLYGALGGLLGALAFGELVWYLLQPPPPPPPRPPEPEPRLALTASADLQLYQGGVGKLFVQILRDDFDGPVAVRAENLPAGVTAAEVVIPAGAAEAEVELRAAAGAAVVAAAPVRLVAAAAPGGKAARASAPTALTTLAARRPQVDIVFVLDVTGSMQEQIDGLKDGIGTFARDLSRAEVDARFGCVAFRDLFVVEPNGFPRMEALTFDGADFTADAGAFGRAVGGQRASGGDDVPETSLEALAEAAGRKDWRKAASRVLILITDAPPKSDPLAKPFAGHTLTVKEAVDALRANRIDFLHLVIGSEDPRVTRRMQAVYRQVQQGAAGLVTDKGAADRGKEFDLQGVARNAKAFTDTLLPEMSRAIVAAAEAKRPEAKPELARRPEARPELAPRARSVQSEETYDTAAAGRLVLAVGAWTGAVAALVCLFLVAGQHHYLRGTPPAAGGVLAGACGGLAAGFVGGAAGQGLFLLADAESAALGAAFRVLGWTLLGSLAGLGLALFVPNLKLVHGLAGGAAGGAGGALGYIAVTAVAGAFPGRVAGGLVLGLFIGLMVALVEAAFRRAWLEVSYGPRETVTVNLGPEPVKVGSDARACTVWARGAAAIELRYFVRNGQVICSDVPARAEDAVADGDTRRAGNVTVVVRTGGGGAAPASAKAAPASAGRRGSTPRAKPLGLDADLPLPAFDPPAPPPVPAAPPTPSITQPTPRPPIPVPGAGPRRPVSPPPVQPASKPTARDPDACPACGRKNPGRPGTRYCVVCDRTY